MRIMIPFICLTLLFATCVDSAAPEFEATVNVIVVDGAITNLPEEQAIRLNRSKADPFTGRFGTLPLTGIQLTVIVDNGQQIHFQEAQPGRYVGPTGFRGEIGHTYRLHFSLSDGTNYESDAQRMPSVPAIDKLSVRFNINSLPVGLYSNAFRAGYDLYINTQDPVNEHNYYRWDWNLYEKQKWCRSCYQNTYVDTVQYNYYQNGIYGFTREAIENCVSPSGQPYREYRNDYICRSPCWEILHNYNLNLFDDQLANGSLVNGRLVAAVPFFTRQPALLEVRQVSLTAEAYQFYKIFQQQTQNTGGLADTPSTAPVGNVYNPANSRERVVGYFTANAVTIARYWLDKKDATRLPLGAYDAEWNIIQNNEELYYAEYRRAPNLGPLGPPFTSDGQARYVTAPCTASDNRTPVKPEGWQN